MANNVSTQKENSKVKKGKRGQGEGSIYKRQDGRWVGVVNLGYQNGKLKRKYYYGETRKEVSDKLNDALNKVKRGRPLADERQTVGHFLDWWLDECIRPYKRYNTYKSYEKVIRVHLKPAFGRVPLLKLSPMQVQEFLNGKLKAGLKPRTIALFRTVLRAALKQAMLWEKVDRNAAQLTNPISIDKKAAGAAMNPDEVQKFMKVLEGERLGVLYLTTLALGLREGEALGLRWEDVDFEKRVLRVRMNLQAVEGELELCELKNDSSLRDLPLLDIVSEALKKHRLRQLQDRMLAGSRWKDSGLVFTSTVGTPLFRRNVLKKFHQILKNAGLPRFRFHDLRHSAATLLLSQGVPLKLVSDILGHSKLSTTADIYAHIQPELRREALSPMEAILSGGR